MNPFAWLIRKTKEAMAEGMRQFFAEINPENPPADLAQLRALVSEPLPALPPAADVEGEKPTRKARGGADK